MLLLGSQLIGTSVMGLQTGTKLAELSEPLIDPANLKILAYSLQGALLIESPSYILMNDVREFSSIGMIIDSSEEFIGLHDVVKVEKLHGLNFKLVGMAVIDQHRRKLGKVDDYSVESASFVIEQLNVKKSVLAITDTSLLINRAQIVEINDRHIIVRTTAKKIEPVMESQQREYVNPFRSPAPQPESSNI
jgi:sporulation protein YlmC with PRC-barrel domain